MKKFLVTLLLAMTIFIPTITAQAADIPDIRQISSSIQPNYSGSDANLSIYIYTCQNGNAINSAAQFVQMLTRNYPFKIYFSDTSGGEGEWALVYTGNKRVATSENMKDGGGHYVQVLIMAEGNEIDLRIVKGLSYAGHFVKDF